MARRLPALVRAAGEPDLLLLNEVPMRVGEPLRRALGPEWRGCSGPGARYLGVVPFSQAILWRDGGAIAALEKLASLGLGQGRRALVARVSFSGGTALVAVAHLTPQTLLPSIRRGGIRARQLERLASGLAGHSREGEPILLGGDFNYATVKGDESEHRRAENLLARRLDLADVATRKGPSPAASTWPTAGLSSLRLGPQRLDLFYVSGSALASVRDFEVLPWTFAQSGSDHAAVRMVVELERAAVGLPRVGAEARVRPSQEGS